MHTRIFELAIDLIHAVAGRGSLSVVAAKEAVCGPTIPATDFRRALAYAHGAAWIEYDHDYLSITLTPARKSMACFVRSDADSNADALGAFRKRWGCGS